MTETVDVDELHVGMFIHLDVGWMSHPFPLSSFKITSEDQIRTIQGLGLRSVRWSPDRSDEPQAPTTAPQPKTKSRAAQPPTSAGDPLAQARRQRAQRLQDQLAAMHQCEKQFVEACRELRQINELVDAQPAQAHAASRQLTQAVLDKMMVEGDICVRVLPEQQIERYTAHAMNVAVVSLMLGRTIGLAPAELTELGIGALLHDVGKLAMPERLRQPRNELSASDMALYRDHVARGVVHGRQMALGAGAMLVIAQHHELADASGYPSGVGLDKTSTLARLVAMVNHYDNLCNADVPSRAMTPHEALSHMFAYMRGKFDPVMLNAFIRMMGIYPPGSLVQLSDDRFAMVVSVNAARPLKPRVMLFDPSVDPQEALHLDLQTTPDLGIRRSLRSQQLPAPAVSYLAPRQRVAYYFDIEAAPAEQE